MSPFDVAVVGGGPAGIAAALAAARAGAHTLLVERDPAPGGNVSQALVHTICGLYAADAGERPEVLHPGLPARLAEALARAGGAGAPVASGRVHYLPIRPPVFARLAEEACRRAASLVWRPATALCGAELARDARGESELALRGPGGESRERARIVLDTSGEAAAAALGGADSRLEPGAKRQRASFIFRLEGVAEAGFEGFARLQLSAAVARAARTGALPPGCESVVVRRDAADSLYATLTLPGGGEGDPPDGGAQRGRAWAEKVVAFLRETRPGFASARVADWPARVGVREAARVAGCVEIDREHVLAGARHPDEVAHSAWPIELWEDHRRPRFEVPAAPCSVPLGALVSRSHPRLGTAGRCLSASHEALGALRVVGTALATGEAVGVAAALAADADGALGEVPAQRVRARILEQAHGYALP